VRDAAAVCWLEAMRRAMMLWLAVKGGGLQEVWGECGARVGKFCFFPQGCFSER
jgi:hypothetical protein